jgi:hypothetical protein
LESILSNFQRPEGRFYSSPIVAQFTENAMVFPQMIWNGSKVFKNSEMGFVPKTKVGSEIEVHPAKIEQQGEE